MRKLDFYWATRKEWYHHLPDGSIVVNKDAPEEAQKSYEHYVEQMNDERGPA